MALPFLLLSVNSLLVSQRTALSPSVVIRHRRPQIRIPRPRTPTGLCHPLRCPKGTMLLQAPLVSRQIPNRSVLRLTSARRPKRIG